MADRTILVINANTSASMTREIDEAANKAASRGTTIMTVPSKRGPRTILGPVDSALSIPGMLEAAKEHAGQFQAIISACFGDPGLEALKWAFGVPVVGIRESAFHIASFIGNQISVIIPVKGAEKRIRQFARQTGLEDKLLSVVYAGVTVPELEACSPGVEEHVYAAGKEAVDHGADVLIFGCAGMGGTLYKIAPRFEVPCIDPVQAAVRVAEGLLYFCDGISFQGRPFQPHIAGYPELTNEGPGKRTEDPKSP